MAGLKKGDVVTNEYLDALEHEQWFKIRMMMMP